MNEQTNEELDIEFNVEDIPENMVNTDDNASQYNFDEEDIELIRSFENDNNDNNNKPKKQKIDSGTIYCNWFNNIIKYIDSHKSDWTIKNLTSCYEWVNLSGEKRDVFINGKPFLDIDGNRIRDIKFKGCIFCIWCNKWISINGSSGNLKRHIKGPHLKNGVTYLNKNRNTIDSYYQSNNKCFEKSEQYQLRAGLHCYLNCRGISDKAIHQTIIRVELI